MEGSQDTFTELQGKQDTPFRVFTLFACIFLFYLHEDLL